MLSIIVLMSLKQLMVDTRLIDSCNSDMVHLVVMRRSFLPSNHPSKYVFFSEFQYAKPDT